MCDIFYRAVDGKEFKTKKECVEWNSRPRVWIIYSYSTHIKIEGVCVCKEVAQAVVDKHNSNENRMWSLSMESKVIDTSTEVTVHSAIKNKVVKKSWLQKLKGLV